MPITQRFYPTFFQYALRGAQSTTFSNTLEDSRVHRLACKIVLLTSAATYDQNDYKTSDLALDEVIAGTVQNCLVSMVNSTYNGPNTLEFFFSPKTWSGPFSEPFRHAVVYTLPITGTDDVSDDFGGGAGKADSGLLFMHIDLGEEFNPTGDFTLSLNMDSCIPHIDFTPEACAAGGGSAPPTYDSGEWF